MKKNVDLTAEVFCSYICDLRLSCTQVIILEAKLESTINKFIIHMDVVTNELRVKHTTCKLINEATMQSKQIIAFLLHCVLMSLSLLLASSSSLRRCSKRSCFYK